VLRLNPSLPGELDGLDFDVRYHGHWGISLHLTPDRLRVRVAADGATPVRIAVNGQVVELAPGSAQEFPL
jgi:trehalose/maltose hydrolase-like predicted phosphorylase